MTRGIVGSGDAYNYGLAIADSVTQVRAGVIPPMVGQGEYAYNGRVHPLRTAPYICLLAAGLDAATFHTLTFWEVQNLCIGLSLAASVLACFWSLRSGTGCSPWAAVFLSAVYAASPPILSAAYSFDLFMTVCAAPFVPLAIGACARACRKPSFAADAGIAASLAGAWLAHPPVAAWLTVGVAAVRTVNLLAFPSWRSLFGYLGAAVLGLALAAYVFVSVACLFPGSSPFSGEALVRQQTSHGILQIEQDSFPGSLLPVSAPANRLSDVQLGYAGWGVLLVSVACCFGGFAGAPGRDALRDRLTAVSSSLFAVFAALLVLPVPGVTLWLWLHIPEAASDITNIWPMYRLYLVALGFAVFGAALGSNAWRGAPAPLRTLLALAVLGSAAWLLSEAGVFVRRGFRIQSGAAEAASLYRPSNADLMITSYAFLGPSPWFAYGVSDPQFEFRILDSHGREVASPTRAALESSPIVLHGKLRRRPDGIQGYSASLVLEPRHRYLLTFDFKTRPVVGTLRFTGTDLKRRYYLANAGSPRGFGMLPGESRTITLWTDSEHPEAVEMALEVSDPTFPAAELPETFAEFVLQDARLDGLPVRLGSLLPLRCSVNAPEDHCALETPRRFVSGYEAWVNGDRAKVEAAGDGQVMVAVPRGRSEVELRYVGPPQLRVAFWTSALAWICFLTWRCGVLRVPLVARPLGRAADIAALLASKRKGYTISAVAALIAGAAWLAVSSRERYLDSVGPILIDFRLPNSQTGHVQPLLATGAPGRGTVVSISYPDASHVVVGADVQGTLFRSNPIECDYSKPQTLVVSDSALFPVDHPRVRALDASFRESLRGNLRVEFNGQPAIDVMASAYGARASEVYIGHSEFGRSSEARFQGQILSTRRLPIPQPYSASAGDHVRLRAQFPRGRTGRTEPLASFFDGPERLFLAATYDSSRQITLSLRRSDGTIIGSAPVDSHPGAAYSLEIVPGRFPDRSLRVSVTIRAEGRLLLGEPRLVPLDQPQGFVLEPVVSGIPGVDARFTGPRLSASTLHGAETHQPERSWGPVRMVLLFPKDRLHRSDPLVSSGRTGAGDSVYVIYDDASHVRFGFDDWARSTAVTEPVPIDYDAPHDLQISMGSLFPELTDDFNWEGLPLSGRVQAKAEVRVVLDGTVVLSKAYPTFASTPTEVSVGANGIGTSTSDSSFYGKILFADRQGSMGGK